MTGYGSSWFGIVAGVLAIVLGVYSLLRTGSVASWLESHGVHHAAIAIEDICHGLLIFTADALQQ